MPKIKLIKKQHLHLIAVCKNEIDSLKSAQTIF